MGTEKPLLNNISQLNMENQGSLSELVKVVAVYKSKNPHHKVKKGKIRNSVNWLFSSAPSYVDIDSL